jgi:hypothetical protein
MTGERREGEEGTHEVRRHYIRPIVGGGELEEGHK